ncbi:MAG: metallophosphoesterase, partial [candidate division WOR-3 bacterium]|nr:metallophosphoesterase [candidate division WOR-3 bacterium]
MMRNTKLLVVGIILSSLKTIIAIEPLSFSFVVLGDRTGGADHVVFEQVVKQIKLINPDFIINIGDLIEGYTSDTQKINQEWDLIFSTLGKLKEKFYFTPGNHDIWDQISSQIYLNRTGYKKPYYAFSAHKCHFVIIDNSQEEKIYEFDSVQLKWLNSTLAKYKRNDIVFCFMHKSFWKDTYINNKPDTLHKLF